MTKRKGTIIPSSERKLNGSPYPGIVGDSIQYKVDIGSTVEVDGTCWMHAWKGTSDVSGEILSGSMTASGNFVTLKVISSEKAAEYMYTFKVKTRGHYIVYRFARIVERESGAK